MADVTLKHVYKVYDGGVRAVNDFDLEIKDKEFVVFVGPSGCGKSTTLRMIAGLEDITAGHLYIDGELMNEVEPKNRDIAMVFQSYALYPHMTVYDNMAFGLKLRHVSKAEIDQRVKAAAEILEISDLLSRKPKALSGGQRQRVALGRTIVREPKVFLLDEPLSNLDAKLRVAMRSEITKLHEKLQTTFIYVTHDQTEAMTMGNRIVVMKDGFIQQADTPITLFEDPANLFVATFLGSPQMNILDAELFMDGDILKAKLNGSDDLIVSFPEIKAKQLADKKYIGNKVLLGIRPENVNVGEDGLNAFIDVVEHLGDESILYTKMENRKDPFIVKLPFLGKIKSNADVKLTFDMNRVYLFDEKTHKSIMGIPAEDEMPARLVGNKLTLGKQNITVSDEFLSHCLAKAFEEDMKFAIKPDYISLEKMDNSIEINAKVEFVEPKTDYNAVYFSLEGVDGYFAFKMKHENEVPVGKQVKLYIPEAKIRLYDNEHDKAISKETVFPNSGVGYLKNVNGNMHITVAGTTLVYPSQEGIEDGRYEVTLDQNKLVPIYTGKMLKEGYSNDSSLPKNNRIKVSSYDEDVLGEKVVAYVKVKGFENYSTFVFDNDFSVYKMPVFNMYVPFEGITLKKID